MTHTDCTGTEDLEFSLKQLNWRIRVKKELLAESTNPNQTDSLRKLAIDLLDWLELQNGAIDAGTYQLATLTSELGGEGRLLKDPPSDATMSTWGWDTKKIADHKRDWVTLCAELGFHKALPPLPPAVLYSPDNAKPLDVVNEFED